MATNQDTKNGFVLPAPSDAVVTEPKAKPASPSGAGALSASEGVAIQPTTDIVPISETSSRDMLVGGGILLVLLIAFFFAKNAYANALVAKRFEPSRANAAGWALFIMLAVLAMTGVLGAVNSAKFMSPLYIGCLVLIGLVALVQLLKFSRK